MCKLLDYLSVVIATLNPIQYYSSGISEVRAMARGLIRGWVGQFVLEQNGYSSDLSSAQHRKQAPSSHVPMNFIIFPKAFSYSYTKIRLYLVFPNSGVYLAIYNLIDFKKKN